MQHTTIVLFASLVAVASPDVANQLHETGVAAHLERCLGDAMRSYDAALALVPPVAPTAEQRARVLRLAPRVFVNAREPFGLRDAAAIIHPTEPIIAYHLFWDDDIDFPDDSEPSDHEVLWVRHDADGQLTAVATLFHGRVVNMPSEVIARIRKSGSRPRIDVQWGKHGLMPEGWPDLTIDTEETDVDTGIPAGRQITLFEYNRLSWLKLSTQGARSRQHPLAVRHGWPSRFEGDLAAFVSFGREVDARDLLERRMLMLVSQWNTGPLARHLLLYNFRPKLEWPEPLE